MSSRDRIIIPIIIYLLFAFVPFLHADTTWVAGDVYGVWDTTGSPFMVTDTITVPLDSTLEIRPGVEIWFLDQEIRRTPILVHGRLRAMGDEGDSIYFYSPVAGFGGISNEDISDTEIRLEFCVIDSMASEIYSRYGQSVVLKHSRIHRIGGRVIYSRFQADTVQYCNLTGAVSFYYGSSGVFQHNITNSTFGTLNQQMAPIFDNQVQGIILSQGSLVEVYDNSLAFAQVEFNDGYWHDNSIQGTVSIFGGDITLENNLMGFLDIDETGQTSIVQNRINGSIWVDHASAVFQNNLIIATTYSTSDAIWILDSSFPQQVAGNTIVFRRNGISATQLTPPFLIKNNIFVGDGSDCRGVYSSSQSSGDIDIRYNDFYQVTLPVYNCQLDTGNIFLDPCFRAGSPYDYQLQANSPCIDAGDPSSPLDPDDTRADIGCYYFDQLHDQPPAITSPTEVHIQLGGIMQYTAQATDDNGPLHFGFWELPRWLHRIYPVIDFVENSAYLSGRTPSNQEDFTFGIWVEDGLAQRDSQEVSVIVSPYTILEGEATGVLTVEESPYYVVDEVIVPGGDSLRIEPGVELIFKYHEQLDLRPRIVVRGRLTAIGTREDSIRFVPEFGDSLRSAWRGVWCFGASMDTSIIKYAYFTTGNYGVAVDSQARVLVEHSKILDTRYGIYAINNSWVGMDSCQFFIYNPYDNNNLYLDNSSVTITNCHSEFIVPYITASHFDFQNSSMATVKGCSFIGGGYGRLNYGGRMEFIGNRVIHTNSGINYGNGGSGIAANNIFSGGDGLGSFSGDSVLFSNNLLFNMDIGIDVYGVYDEMYIKNNIFLGNNYGIRFRDGPAPFTAIFYNDFFDNDSDLVYCECDSTNLFLDPLVHDTIDFRLSLDSPCINAGDPDPFFNDPDSTRNDIGCWGGPWGESYPYVPVFSDHSKPIPEDYALLPPFPNPFNNVLIIPFTLPIEKEVMITIYNILGQKVQEFTFPPLSPGVHRVVWNSSSCASGLYIIQLISGDNAFKQKAVLIR